MNQKQRKSVAKTVIGLSIANIVLTCLLFASFCAIFAVVAESVSKYIEEAVNTTGRFSRSSEEIEAKRNLDIGIISFFIFIFSLALFIVGIITIVYANRLYKIRKSSSITAGWALILVGFFMSFSLFFITIIGAAFLINSAKEVLKGKYDNETDKLYDGLPKTREEFKNNQVSTRWTE